MLDVGCGVGPLTQALARELPGCRVTGIDISESGIAYARKKYPQCGFEVCAVSEATDLGRKFDVVHAREFYPFTRTIDFQRKYIEVLAKHVNTDGSLVLTFLSKSKSLAANAQRLSPVLESLGMTPLQSVTLASARIPAGIPLPVARGMTSLMLRLFGRDVVRFYVSRRSSANPAGR